jgi:hypothetical protein
MPAGRPLETIEDLWKGWYNDILGLYMEGASDVEIKALIWKKRGSFSNTLWDRWMAEEPQFSETIKMGKLLSEAWWKREGRENLKVTQFNYTGWYMNMRNRFGWADRQVSESTQTIEDKRVDISKLSDEQLRTLDELQRIARTGKA